MSIDTQRRKMIAATMAVGAASLAGCTAGDEDAENASDKELGDDGPPTFDYKTDNLDPEMRFIIESLQWQNEQLAE